MIRFVLITFLAASGSALSGVPLGEAVKKVQTEQAANSADILSQAGLLEDLGMKSASDGGAGFRYNLAYQRLYLKGSDKYASDVMGEHIAEASELVVPFCHQNSCILTTFAYTDSSGAVEMISYGASAKAERIAEGFARLEKLRPELKGKAQIVEYPQGMFDLLMFDDPRTGETVLMPATEEMANRAHGMLSHLPDLPENGQLNFLNASMVSELKIKVNETAQSTIPEIIPLRPDTPPVTEPSPEPLVKIATEAKATPEPERSPSVLPEPTQVPSLSWKWGISLIALTLALLIIWNRLTNMRRRTI